MEKTDLIYIAPVCDGKKVLKTSELLPMWKYRIKNKHLLFLVMEYYKDAIGLFFSSKNESLIFPSKILLELNVITTALKAKCGMEEILILLRAHP